MPCGGLVAGHLQAGETLLVRGATGNFGSAAVAVAVALAMRAGCVVDPGRNETTLSWVAKTNHQRCRAYLMKEKLRLVFKLCGDTGIRLLVAWLGWHRGRRSRRSWDWPAPSAATARPSGPAVTHGLSNARVESANTKIRLLQRAAFGYRNPDALIAMAMLDLGGCCPAPAWPGRVSPREPRGPAPEPPRTPLRSGLSSDKQRTPSPPSQDRTRSRPLRAARQTSRSTGQRAT